MQKHANLIWFVCSLILIALSGYCLHIANVAQATLYDGSNTRFLPLQAFHIIFFECALAYSLGVIVGLFGALVALVSGIGLLVKRNGK
ncbi:MAG TPA: hypothetical protein V6C81_02705 [Planktothrix sp.]|jgi:hypothetical protein